MLADIQASSPDELTFRERVVIWQARRLGDRGAFVHLDRLAGSLASRPSSRSGLFDALATAAQREGVADERGKLDPSRISLPGRLLVLSSLVVFGLAFWAEMEILVDQLERLGHARFPLLPVIPGLIALAYLRLGIGSLRHLGIPFRAGAATARDDPR